MTRFPRALLSAVLMILVLYGIMTGNAMSATINVTASAPDVLNGADGQCSLREAITNINNGATSYADCAPTGAYGTSDTINISAGTYTTAIAGAGENLNATGDFDITNSVSIVGAGASTTIVNGGGLDRVIQINPANTAGIVFSLSGATITGGAKSSATPACGGGIFSLSSATLNVTNSTISGNTSVDGAGICIDGGPLNVTNSTVSGNTGSNAGGGIVTASSTATIINSTIIGNTGGYGGGGIYNLRVGGPLTVINSTISGNTGGYGGAITNDFSGTIIVKNSTISGNMSSTGAIHAFQGTTTVTNSIVANQSSGADCALWGGAIISGGHNLESATSCGFTGTGDLQTANPLLGALGNNGGPTQTMALLAGSPAIDAGDAAVCAAAPVSGVDQRGYARPAGAACDSGAYEYGTYTVTTTATNGTITSVNNPSVNQASTTVTGSADANYYFTGVSGCSGTPQTNTDQAVTTFSYTTGVITAPCTVTATFAIKTYTLSYSAGANGSLTGTASQTVNYNASGSAVTAVPATGYHFVNWSDSSTANPRTDSNVAANVTVTANFAINTYSLSYSAGANGSLTGTASQTVNYNTSGSAVTAVPDANYHFVNWSDSQTANPRTDSSVTANVTVTANFAIDTFALSYSAGANGSLTGAASQTVNYNASGSAVTAVPATGYHFVNWSDSQTANPRTDSSVTANVTVTANFAINTYSLSYTAGANGSLTGTISQTVNYNTSGSAVTAVPATGYHFVNWSDSSTANPRTDSSVAANVTVTANFAIFTTYNGPTATGTGTASATVSGGGAECVFTAAQFVPLGVTAPAGVSFPQGLFDFTLGGCSGTATLTVTYPDAVPAGTQYWKYGPTPGDATLHWYTIPAVIFGNTITFSITDGGLGDDDVTVNGIIVDQGGPGVQAQSNGAATPIPTLSEWGMILLSGLLGLIGVGAIRRRLL